MKKILVTGASGFLGWHIVNTLQNRFSVLGTYSSTPVSFPMAETCFIDITNPDSVKSCFAGFSPDVIIHAAAEANGKICEENPEHARLVNVSGTETIIHAILNPETLLIYISTDLVFDGKNAPYSETDAPAPLSQYGLSKLQAEEAVQRLWKHHVIVRPPLMFGSPAATGKGCFLQWIDQMFQKGGKAPLFIDEIRTPADVEDVVSALLLVIENPGPYRLYHAGGPERLTRVEFGKRLAAVRNYDPDMISVTRLSEMNTGYPRPEDVSLDSSRLIQTYGFRLTPIEESLRMIYL